MRVDSAQIYHNRLVFRRLFRRVCKKYVQFFRESRTDGKENLEVVDQKTTVNCSQNFLVSIL